MQRYCQELLKNLEVEPMWHHGKVLVKQAVDLIVAKLHVHNLGVVLPSGPHIDFTTESLLNYMSLHQKSNVLPTIEILTQFEMSFSLEGRTKSINKAAELLKMIY